jgi:Tfp pilus assembly protein PilF
MPCQMLGKILLALMLAQAQQGNGVIRGQIWASSARIWDRIPVTIERVDGPVAARVFSDVQGNYEARNLQPGVYTVIVNVEGYEEVRQQVGVGGGILAGVTLNIPLSEKAIAIRRDANPADDVVDVTELSRKHPKKALQDYDKARQELRKGNDGRAIELLVGVVKLAPDFYNAHYFIGNLYQKANRFPEAEAAYRRARELNPRAPEPLISIGSLLIDDAAARATEGKRVVGKILDDALDILEESLKLKRTSKGYYYLGTAYYKSAFYEEAEANLKQAVEMDARMGAAHLMLANLYLKQQKWNEALAELDTYLTGNPTATDRVQILEIRTKVAGRIR